MTVKSHLHDAATRIGMRKAVLLYVNVIEKLADYFSHLGGQFDFHPNLWSYTAVCRLV